MKANEKSSGCPLKMNRRSFLASSGTLAAAGKMGLLDFASSLFAAESQSGRKPLVRAVFVRPDVDSYWMGWPGAAYDIKARQKQYTEILNAAAKKYGVELVVVAEPLHDENAVNQFLGMLKNTPPDGLFVISMSLNQSWPHINKIAKERGSIPTIVFSPMGTSFTSHLQGTRNIPGVCVAATQDLDWLDFGVRMQSTIWKMKNTRICVVQGNKTEDRQIDVVGTTLHYIPRSRWPEEFKKIEATDEVRTIADYYTKNAKKIVEPNKQDILNAAKNYVLARQILAAENCDGISVDCLPLVG